MPARVIGWSNNLDATESRYMMFPKQWANITQPKSDCTTLGPMAADVRNLKTMERYWIMTPIRFARNWKARIVSIKRVVSAE